MFWGKTPNFELVFKIGPISDHVAKFRGDRLRDRDLALKKKDRKEINSSKTQGPLARCVIATGGPKKEK